MWGKMAVLNFFSGAPNQPGLLPRRLRARHFPRSRCDGSRLSRVSSQAAVTPLHRSVRQFSTPQNTPARQYRPTVYVFDHGSQIAAEMIGDLTTPFMDGSNNVIEILSRRVGCHRSSGFLEYR